MEYRTLGRSNLQVSALCLGTMMFADQTSQAEAASIVDAAAAQGVNFIDTADNYARGAGEAMVGALLEGRRHQWVLASKLGNKMSERPNEGHYSRSWMLREVDNSLRRLRTDHLDILYLHRDVNGMPLDEPLWALESLLRAGKIRYWGLSNFRGWRIAEAVRLSAAIGMPGPAVCQLYYNLLNRLPETEILPACRHHGIGVVPYSPIARGVLTGKYRQGERPAPDTRAGRGDPRIVQTEMHEASLRIAERLGAHAQGRGTGLVAFAVAWVLANRAVSAVIAGPRTLAQWQAYLPALELRLEAGDEALVDSLVPAGHCAAPGYTDPLTPVEGRFVAA